VYREIWKPGAPGRVLEEHHETETPANLTLHSLVLSFSGLSKALRFEILGNVLHGDCSLSDRCCNAAASGPADVSGRVNHLNPRALPLIGLYIAFRIERQLIAKRFRIGCDPDSNEYSVSFEELMPAGDPVLDGDARYPRFPKNLPYDSVGPHRDTTVAGELVEPFTAGPRPVRSKEEGDALANPREDQ